MAQAAGEGAVTATWDLAPGDWAIVVMNADGSPGVAADIELGGKIDALGPIAIGLAIGGALILALGVALIVGSVVRSPAPASHPESFDSGRLAEPGSYPLRIQGELDPVLSRWKWLVKWLLAIPHAFVLFFLWIAFAVLSIVAFFAILFTGRYPRSIFDFNVGVLRWTWRVSYYASSALGTDRYPPFTLADVDYPARLHIAYPERLSRGLVLVKSWLLAIPHLVIVGIMTSAGAGFGGGRGVAWFGGGLLGAAVCIAAISLLFTHRYPKGLFDLIMGLNRWSYRVIAYVALMTDRYPPFRLDQGPYEADGSMIPLPPPPAEAIAGR